MVVLCISYLIKLALSDESLASQESHGQSIIPDYAANRTIQSNNHKIAYSASEYRYYKQLGKIHSAESFPHLKNIQL